jgi:hypothetical protein
LGLSLLFKFFFESLFTNSTRFLEKISW